MQEAVTCIRKGFHFARYPYIEAETNKLLFTLTSENQLTKLPVEMFANRAAHYLAELNVLHPFREGNGRTQREFIRQLSLNAGYELDWTRISPLKALEASIRSVTDTKQLADVIRSSIVNEVPDKAISRKYRGVDRSMER